MAMIDGADRDRDHLALEPRKAALAEQEIIRHIDERFQLFIIERIGLQHVGNEAELLLTVAKIIAKLQIKLESREAAMP